jgi:sortase A
VLAGIGAALLAVCIALEARALWTRHVMARRLDELAPRETQAGAAGEHGQVAAATRDEASLTGLIGEIEIPRLELSAVVLEGETERTLSAGVGHVVGSAYPGENGNAVLAAHRDTYFAPLEKARAGDSIWIRTPDGRFGYTVDTILVVRPDRVDLLADRGKAELTLVTCYPFYFIGPAPKRWVVQASPLGGPVVRRTTPPTNDGRRGAPRDESLPAVAPAEPLELTPVEN